MWAGLITSVLIPMSRENPKAAAQSGDSARACAAPAQPAAANVNADRAHGNTVPRREPAQAKANETKKRGAARLPFAFVLPSAAGAMGASTLLPGSNAWNALDAKTRRNRPARH